VFRIRETGPQARSKSFSEGNFCHSISDGLDAREVYSHMMAACREWCCRCFGPERVNFEGLAKRASARHVVEISSSDRR